MRKILVLCTGNACRSQMAEGFLRALGKGMIEVRSAGTIAAGLHTRAVAVMKEIGIDISGHKSKTYDLEDLSWADLVITLCDDAATSCPAVPAGVTRQHIPIKDPVLALGTEEQIMNDFRRAREEIHDAMLKVLGEQTL